MPKGKIDEPALAEYVAASIPLHLSDGWGFLSRALDSIVRGDRAAAIHLAYYAELRAAMSLLAAQGIGVFGTKHLALGISNTVARWNGPGTHDAARELLVAWSNTRGSADRILEALYVNGRPFTEAIDEKRLEARGIPTTAPLRQQIAKAWLAAWSIDLRALRKDKNFRNQASYRPWDISVPPPGNIDVTEEVVDSVRELWRSLEPNGASGARIDLNLLDRGLRMIGIPLPPDVQEANYVLEAAEDTTSGVNRASPILARALLLLRLATAACSQTLKDSAVDTDAFGSWWRDLGRRSGFWDDSLGYEELADLWADVALALDEIDDGFEAADSPTPANAVQEVASRPVATQFTRAALWLLPLEI